MPNTPFNGPYIAYTQSGLTQTIARSASMQILSTVELTPSPSNYSKVFTLTCTVNSSVPDTLLIDSYNTNGIPITQVSPTVYTMSSQYTLANGVTVNNWAYFRLLLRQLRITTSGSTWPNPAFTVDMSLTDGTTTSTGILTVSSLAATTPSVPVLSQTRTSKSAINLTWTASTQAVGSIAGYYVYRDGNSTPYATITSGLSYIDSSSTTNHSYTVQSYDTSSIPLLSSLSNSVTTSIASLTAPTAAQTRTSKSAINLTWTASTANWGTWSNTYNIYRDSSYLTTVTSALTYTDSSAGTGSHTYYIIANDSVGTPVSSAASNTVITSVSTLTTVVLSSTRPTKTSVNLTWTASTANWGTWSNTYNIYRDSSYLTTVTSALTYTDSSAGTGSHTYYIIANDSVGTPVSSAASNTITQFPILTIPGSVLAVRNNLVSATITWTASTANWGTWSNTYNIYRDSVLFQANVSGLTYTDTSSNKNGYTYTITAVDSPTESSQSTASSISSIEYFIVHGNTSLATAKTGAWTLRTMPTGAGWNDPVAGNILVATTNAATTNAATSIDAITWNSMTMPSTGPWKSAVWGNNIFVCVKTDSTSQYATSTDGITWTSRTLPVTSTWNMPAYDNGIFIILSSNQNYCYTSADGITWTSRTLPTTGTYDYGMPKFGGGKWLICGYSAGLATSPDGITWTHQTNPDTVFGAGATSNQATYASGMWVINGYINGIFYSTDAITWTGAALPGGTGTPFMYGPPMYSGGKWVTVRGGTTKDSICYSSDGISWTAVTLTGGQWGSTPYAFGAPTVKNGIFKIVLRATDIYFSANTIYSSSNGTTWTVDTFPLSEPVNGICNGNNP